MSSTHILETKFKSDDNNKNYSQVTEFVFSPQTLEIKFKSGNNDKNCSQITEFVSSPQILDTKLKSDNSNEVKKIMIFDSKLCFILLKSHKNNDNSY